MMAGRLATSSASGPVCVVVLLILGVSGATVSVHGTHFQRDRLYDDRSVTNDAGSLHLVARTLAHCAYACAQRGWCSSFFYTVTSGACSLHGTVFVSASITQATVSPGTRYYRAEVDWCPPEPGLVYNRPADMCVYFETTNLEPWNSVDQGCVTRGWGLVSNVTPLRLDALLNMTLKNPSNHYSLFIGLKRTAPGESTFEWMDGSPLDVPSLVPYWEANQPNGACCNQDCVVIRGSVDGTLNDVTCSNPHPYICEALKP